MMFTRILAAVILIAGVACSPRQKLRPVPPPPRIIPHSAWETQPRLGYAADATRRNAAAGDSLAFRGFTITVLSTAVDSTTPKPTDIVRLRLSLGATSDVRTAREGSAFNWNGFHVAVVAIYGPQELGRGLVALEIATVASLPPRIASSDSAGGADMRLRIAHNITHVTLHHTGDAHPLMPGEDPVRRLRGLQSWGATDRNWWDVPYHYLLGIDGSIYEGRDWHYMGETNTSYNPGGHFLISAIGNYDEQEATPATLNAIADLMAWAIRKFDLPLSSIGGHYNYAQTGCPGKNLRKFLEDGTLKRMVAQRLK
jgi:hypothetical protein